MSERSNALSNPSLAPTLQVLVESALTMADEQGRWDLSIHLNQALTALDGAGRMPPKATLLELGWSSNRALHLH